MMAKTFRNGLGLIGKYGDKLWNGTTMPIDSQSFDSIAQDTAREHLSGTAELRLQQNPMHRHTICACGFATAPERKARVIKT